MARPGRKIGSMHSELVRDRIKTAQIVNRLTAYILGTGKGKLKGAIMEPAQVTAALGLLKKTIPDIQSIEHLGEVAHVVHAVSSEPLSEGDWQAKYGGQAQPLNG
jgi:hypothetical protein